jgi:hypothetical protein
MSNPLTVIRDTVSPDLRFRAMRVGDSAALNKVVGAAGAKVFREHFVKRAATEKNKFGAPSRFWAKMRRLTTWKSDAGSAKVIMPAEVRLRLKGGVVRPTGGRKALTIPVDRRSYGRAARTFRDLVFIGPKAGEGGKFRGLLAQPTGKGTFRTLYTLWAFTRHKPDPTVFPKHEAIAAEVRTAVLGYLQPREARL